MLYSIDNFGYDESNAFFLEAEDLEHSALFRSGNQSHSTWGNYGGWGWGNHWGFHGHHGGSHGPTQTSVVVSTSAYSYTSPGPGDSVYGGNNSLLPGIGSQPIQVQSTAVGTVAATIGSSVTVTYSFDPSLNLLQYIYSDLPAAAQPGFTPSEQAFTLLAMQQYSDVANITFVDWNADNLGRPVADLSFYFFDASVTFAAGFANDLFFTTPFSAVAPVLALDFGFGPLSLGLPFGETNIVGNPIFGDATLMNVGIGEEYRNELNPYSFGLDPVIASNPLNYGYQAVLHEIGHTLGLAHPFEYSIPEDNYNNSPDVAVMNYPTRDSGDYIFLENPSTVTLRMFDIAALQYLYGANTAYHAGNTVYTFTGVTDYPTVWDGGGVDTYSAATYGNAVLLDLREDPNAVSVVGGTVQWTAFNANIENAVGSVKGDVIYGNKLNNQLTGGGGNDRFIFTGPTIGADKITDFNSGDILDLRNLGISSSYLDSNHDGKVTGADAHADLISGSLVLTFAQGTIQLNGVSQLALKDFWLTDTSIASLNLAAGSGLIGATLIGDKMNDTLTGGNGPDNLYGYGGDDKINGGAGDDRIFGGDGNDKIDGGSGNNTIHGGDGDDKIATGNGDDIIFAGDGNDTIDAGNGNNSIHDEAGNDYIIGGSGNDTVNNGAGNDIINTGDGNDVIFSDEADTGNDKIDTGSGDDYVETGTGNCIVNGGVGDDVVVLGSGNNIVNGGDGSDLVVLLSDVTGGTNTIDGGAGDDVVVLYSGSNTVYGGAGDDLVFLYGGSNTVYGGAGNDHFEGGSGNDKMFGEAGDDFLFGGGGNDTLDGGSGHDVFLFAVDASLSFGNDTINHWQSGQDKLDLTYLGLDGASLDSNHDNHITGLDDYVNQNGSSLVIDLGSIGSITITHENSLNLGDFASLTAFSSLAGGSGSSGGGGSSADSSGALGLIGQDLSLAHPEIDALLQTLGQHDSLS